MSLKQILLADLQRQYYYEGISDLQPTLLGIIKRVLNPRFTPVFLTRLAYHLASLGLNPIAKIISLLNFIIFGIEISLRCKIGEGLYLPHTVGTVVGANKIGRNVVIFQGVTIGAKELDFVVTPEQRPSIGDNVTIGSGAKVLGGIEIGNNVTIGANAVVTKSLPDNVIAAGIPARIIRTLEPTVEIIS
jgi:serine O-acetyltransferase